MLYNDSMSHSSSFCTFTWALFHSEISFLLHKQRTFAIFWLSSLCIIFFNTDWNVDMTLLWPRQWTAFMKAVINSSVNQTPKPHHLEDINRQIISMAFPFFFFFKESKASLNTQLSTISLLSYSGIWGCHLKTAYNPN